jgi:uncharacterized protein (TIGR00725 family)
MVGRKAMKKQLIVGVMGGGSATPSDAACAYRLGSLIAQNGWILLNGGRNVGMMDASAKGAWDHNGMTIGILPNDTLGGVSEYIKIPILTGMGAARNCINILSSDIVVACPGGAGTLSEIALSLKYRKPIIVLNFEAAAFFERFSKKDFFYQVPTPEKAIETIKELISLKRDGEGQLGKKDAQK